MKKRPDYHSGRVFVPVPTRLKLFPTRLDTSPIAQNCNTLIFKYFSFPEKYKDFVPPFFRKTGHHFFPALQGSKGAESK